MSAMPGEARRGSSRLGKARRGPGGWQGKEGREGWGWWTGMGMEEGDGDLLSLCSPSPLPVRSSSASRMVVIAGHSSGNVKVVVGTGEERRIGGE